MPDALLPLDDARSRIADAAEPVQPIELPLAEAYGCVAAVDVTAEYDIPPFSSANVEGLAARSADIVAATPEAPVALRVAGWAMAGRQPDVTVGWGEAVRIATGAPVPAGADCVIGPETFDVEGETVRVRSPVPAGTNVRPAGDDLQAGALLVPAGRRISAPELGALAAAGYGSTLVHPRLRIGVIGVGELIEPGRPAGFGEVRDSTTYLLLGALRDVGALPYRIGVVREVEAGLRDAVSSNTLRADAFVVSGGGDADEVTTALSRLGDIRSHSAALSPGGQVAYGLVEGKPFFQLPAGATAAFVAFEVFVRPAVLRMMGRRDLTRPQVSAILDSPISGPAGMALGVPVRLAHRGGSWRCIPTGPPGSDRVGAIVQANGLLVVPAGDAEVPAGEQVRVEVFRPLER